MNHWQCQKLNPGQSRCFVPVSSTSFQSFSFIFSKLKNTTNST